MNSPNPRLSSTTLPIMPYTASELRRLLDLQSTRNAQLQAVLLTDPAATIALFRELERTRPGAGEQVGDPAHALSMIGVQAFRNLLAALPEADPTAGHAADALADTYSNAAHAASYAGAIAAHKGLPRGEELTTAALLQTPAMLALAVLEPESALRAANAVRDGVPADTAFSAELGEPLPEANLRLAQTWSLPLLARQALGDWDDFNPRPQAVKLADEVARATAAEWHELHDDTLNDMLANFLGLDADAAQAWLHRQAVDAARALHRSGYPAPRYLLPGIPGDDDDVHDGEIPEFGAWRERRKQVDAAVRIDLQATMGEIMRRIRDEAGAARVVFAILDKERSRLRTRLALGGKTEDGIRRLDVDLRHKTLFGALMGKPQSLWLNDDNAGKYRAFIPDSIRTMLAPQGAFMMSLFVGDKPLGLMYGDGSELDDQGYRQFRALCHEATSALTAGSQVSVQ